jgi:hypothetical protein
MVINGGMGRMGMDVALMCVQLVNFHLITRSQSDSHNLTLLTDIVLRHRVRG